MFNHVIIDAVRVARIEAESARSDAPIVEQFQDRPRRERFAGIRLAVSAKLHALADLLEPKQKTFEGAPFANNCR